MPIAGYVTEELKNHARIKILMFLSGKRIRQRFSLMWISFFVRGQNLGDGATATDHELHGSEEPCWRPCYPIGNGEIRPLTP